MSNILVDNWTLQRATDSLRDVLSNNTKPNEELIKLIEAIIIWDNIYYIDNEFSAYWKKILSLLGMEDCFHTAKELFDNEERYNICTEHARYLSLQVPTLIAKGAVEYSSIANYMNVGYLPSKERMEYLTTKEAKQLPISRTNIMSYFDRQMLEYYNLLNKRLGTDMIGFEMPVLFDFIMMNSKDKNYLKTAFGIREEKPVINFRKWMDSFEYNVSLGNIVEIDRLQKGIADIINDITRIHTPSIAGQMHIGITPSLSLPFSIDCGNRKNVHLEFLRSLTSFALTSRKIHM